MPQHDRTDLEQKITFLERELEHLRAELGDAWKKLSELSARMDRLVRTIEDRRDDGIA